MTALNSHHLVAILPIIPTVKTWTSTQLLSMVKQAVQAVGLTIVSEASFAFPGQGVSVVLLLAESHVALHVWPELDKVTIDIHVCDFYQDNLAKAQHLAEQLTVVLSDRTHPDAWQAFSIVG